MMEGIFLKWLACAIVIMNAVAQPDGWKMEDRFYGFRYQIATPEKSSAIDKIQRAADDLGCFGWVQNPRDDVYVGEARCSKAHGPKLEEVIKAQHQGSTSNLAVKVR
jgi:hypothetical protein